MNITYFECARRIQRLSSFRELLARLPAIPSRAKPADRQAINTAIPAVSIDLIDAGEFPSPTLRQALSAGGGVFRDVDALRNLFTAPPDFNLRLLAIDSVDRALGTYQMDLRPARLRTFNPFWWLWRAIAWLSSIPFRLLGWAGFDAEAAESSVLGRVLKTGIVVLGWLAAFVAAILKIFDSPTLAHWLVKLK